MTALLTASQLRNRVPTDLPDDVLDEIIADEQAAIELLYGAASGERVELLSGGENKLFLRRPISTITSIWESLTDATDPVQSIELTEGMHFIVRPAMGYIQRYVTAATAIFSGMPDNFAAYLLVAWTPTEDTLRHTRALADLCRIAITRQAMKTEGVGEYRYQAPEWEDERQAILRRINPFPVRV